MNISRYNPLSVLSDDAGAPARNGHDAFTITIPESGSRKAIYIKAGT